MKTKDIKELPKEFDFKVKYNPFRIIYHAQETEHGYKVTWNVANRIATVTYSKADFRRRLFNDEFLICQ